MDAQVDQLVAQVLERLETAPPSARLLIGLSGVPGSGKSSLARAVVQRLNAAGIGGASHGTEARQSVPLAMVVPMDGWHLSKAQLAAMDDPQLARDKRGAEWTFDGQAFANFVLAVRSAPPDAPAHRAPTFSHSLADPEPDALVVPAAVRVLLFEGLYCNVALPPWGAAALALDLRWVLSIDETRARERLVERHVRTGVAKDAEEARWRADNNDLPNGRFLLQNTLELALRIDSVDDEDWRGQE